MSKDSDSTLSWLGPKLRQARLRRGLSQRDVAEAVGLSESFVRLVESGRSDVSIGRLMRITKLLDVSVSQLVDDEKSSEITVVRVTDRVRLPVREPGVQVELLSPAGVSSIEPGILALDGGVAMRKAMFHRGLELLFVLAGQVRLIVGQSQEDLETGDTAYYPGTVPHRLVNTSATERAIVLMADAG